MIDVVCPKNNVNDENVIVVEILKKTGEHVIKDELIVNIETSKENIEMHAPCSGSLLHKLEEGQEIPIGNVLFSIAEEHSSYATTSSDIFTSEKPQSKDVIFSKTALSKAKELNIDLSVFKSGLITAEVIEEYAKEIGEDSNLTGSFNTSLEKPYAPNTLVICGGGGHSKMCIDILRERKEFEIVGIVDPAIPIGTQICGVNVIGSDDKLKELYEQGVRFAINGLGAVTNPKLRKELFLKLKEIGFFIPNIIHPRAIVEPSAKMGEGNQIMMGACVGSAVTIGNNCIINSGSIISHDSKLSSHCHITPGAILAGQVEVGELTVVGMGVTVFFGKKIGSNAVILNGKHIFADVNNGEIVK